MHKLLKQIAVFLVVSVFLLVPLSCVLAKFLDWLLDVTRTTIRIKKLDTIIPLGN